MRFFVLPLLLLTAAALPRTVAEPAQPRPLVILVHGRGMAGTDTAALRAHWKRELDSALQRTGMPALIDDDVRLAWYADVLDPAMDGACERDGATHSADAGAFVRGFLVSLASLVPDSGREEDRQARSLLGDMLYLVDPATRCAAETRVGRELTAARSTGRPVIVVAYSLGSVVAYELLGRNAAAAPRVELITLGSPLGIPAMRELLTGRFGALRVPTGVSRWVNIYDRDDAFAAPVGLSVPTVVDKVVAGSGSGDPHQAPRYLRDAETGSALARALCDAGTDAYARPCATLRRDQGW